MSVGFLLMFINVTQLSYMTHLGDGGWSDLVHCSLVPSKSTLVSMEHFCSYFTIDVHAKNLVSMPKSLRKRLLEAS